MTVVHGGVFNEIAIKLNNERLKLIKLLPEELREQFENESYVAGGSIYSMYHDNKFKDIDIFIETEDLKNKLLSFFKNLKVSIALFEWSQCWKGEYKGNFFLITKNSISINNIYQIIIKDVGQPFEVVNKFDYHHNMNYIKLNALNIPKVYRLGESSPFMNKYLKYNDSRARDIVGVIMRINKYLERGMTIENKEIASMLLDINHYGFSDEELRMLNSKITSQTFSS